MASGSSTVSVRVRVADCCWLVVTVTSNVAVPMAVGVPVRAPVVARVRPAGSAPPESCNRAVPRAPVAVSDWL